MINKLDKRKIFYHKGQRMPPAQTPVQVVYIVVLTLAGVLLIGVSSLAGTLFIKAYVDPVIMNVFTGITTTALGAITGLLANTRQSQPSNGKPPIIEIQQPVNQPVPVAPVAEPKP